MCRAKSLIERKLTAQEELDALKKEIEALERLNLELLRRRWRSLTGRSAPVQLSRGLLLRMLAYELQIARVGDLDRTTRAVLGEATGVANGQSAACDRNARVAASVTPRPGTVLEREYGGVLHRVAVTKDGCSWNGQGFRSLSEAARAITGTRWSGPRFFGLRADRNTTAQEVAAASVTRDASIAAVDVGR